MPLGIFLVCVNPSVYHVGHGYNLQYLLPPFPCHTTFSVFESHQQGMLTAMQPTPSALGRLRY